MDPNLLEVPMTFQVSRIGPLFNYIFQMADMKSIGLANRKNC
jgi:hypothetical protein